MLAVQVVGIMSLLFIVLSIVLIANDYKELGKELFQATIGFDIFYISIVLFIGLAPMSMG